MRGARPAVPSHRMRCRRTTFINGASCDSYYGAVRLNVARSQALTAIKNRPSG